MKKVEPLPSIIFACKHKSTVIPNPPKDRTNRTGTTDPWPPALLPTQLCQPCAGAQALTWLKEQMQLHLITLNSVRKASYLEELKLRQAGNSDAVVRQIHDKVDENDEEVRYWKECFLEDLQEYLVKLREVWGKNLPDRVEEEFLRAQGEVVRELGRVVGKKREKREPKKTLWAGVRRLLGGA